MIAYTVIAFKGSRYWTFLGWTELWKTLCYCIGSETGKDDFLLHEWPKIFVSILDRRIVSFPIVYFCFLVGLKKRLKDSDLFSDEGTVFRRLLNDETASCIVTSRGLQVFLKHDITHLSEDQLLERLIAFADTGWLNEETHKFYVEKKLFSKYNWKASFLN